MKRIIGCCSLLIAIGSAASLRGSSYDFALFPPASANVAISSTNGINNNGQIVGTGSYASSETAFLTTLNGGLTQFDVPGGLGTAAILTIPAAINDSGEIAGTYYDATGVHGFVRLPDGTYKTLQIPYSTFGLLAPVFETVRVTGINDAGQIVGNFQANQKGMTAVFNGAFIMDANGTFRELYPSNNTEVGGISNNGYILGSYAFLGGSVVTNVVFNTFGQIIQTIPNPSGIFGPGSFASINDNGDAIGSYDYLPYASFLMNVFSGTITSLPLPAHCNAAAVNDLGAIVGTCYSLPPGTPFGYDGFAGFELTPSVPEPGTIWTTLGAVALCAAVARRRHANAKHTRQTIF